MKTPQVLNVARQQFGCPSIEGVALEDHPLGANAHWEARIFGPEVRHALRPHLDALGRAPRASRLAALQVMSYGGSSGEPYLSDITLAWLEDTRQYVVVRQLAPAGAKIAKTAVTVGTPSNATLFASDMWGWGGRLFEASAFETESTSWDTKVRGETTQIDEYGAVTRSPGFLRWGLSGHSLRAGVSLATHMMGVGAISPSALRGAAPHRRSGRVPIPSHPHPIPIPPGTLRPNIPRPL